jgi:hypothetical protein
MINAWGVANLFNPTDVLNPIDMRDPIEPEKLPTITLRLGLLLGPLLVDFYYLPVPETSLLPFPDRIGTEGQLRGYSRWVGGTIGAPSPLPLHYTIAGGAPPSPKPKNGQGAVRMALSIGGVDASLGYAYLVDRLPTLRAVVTMPEPVPTYLDVSVSLEYLRLHAFTLDAEATFGKLRVAGEAVAVLTEDRDDEDDAVDDPWTAAVVGVDYRTSQFFVDHSLHFFLDLTMTQPLVGELPKGIFGRLRHPFRKVALARVAYEAGTDLVASVNAVTSLVSYDLLLNPQVQWSFHEKVHLSAGVQILLGQKNRGTFGRFADNSRFVMGVESSF